MAGCASLDYRWWKRAAPWMYGVNLALLAFVLRGGHSALGAVRWISLGPLGTFQPSEPAKVIVAISLAALLARYRIVNWRTMLAAGRGVPRPGASDPQAAGLGNGARAAGDPDGDLFLRGLQRARFPGLPLLGGSRRCVRCGHERRPQALPARPPAGVSRIPNADPEGAGWNLNQAKIAVGSGGLAGQGLFHGTQTQLNFVPEHSRDFIFTVLGEELGFLGGLVLVGLYALLLVGMTPGDALRARIALGSIWAPGSRRCWPSTSWSTSA